MANSGAASFPSPLARVFLGIVLDLIGKCQTICDSHRSLIQIGAATCLKSSAPRPDYRLLSLDANGGHCQSPLPALTRSVRAYFTSTSRRACARGLRVARMHHCGRAKDRRHCRKLAYSANSLGCQRAAERAVGCQFAVTEPLSAKVSDAHAAAEMEEGEVGTDWKSAGVMSTQDVTDGTNCHNKKRIGAVA
jgi:hypothetical protein